MGQSASLAAPSAAQNIINVRELEDLAYEKTLGNARFMKSVRARYHSGLVVVKLVTKPMPDLDLRPYVRAIKKERELLLDVPNALGFQRILETEWNGYLVRQYIQSSLYDRLSTRPFLDDIEKKWLAFQLLCGLRDCHSRGVFHGDIKTENIVVTSWNWLYITDFSSTYKRLYLPEDNPADFSFFFDISGRRTCYIAPERFLRPGEEGSASEITWAMDVFSAGCVIAEIFLESPIFTLSSLFEYRAGHEAATLQRLERIPDAHVRELVRHMIQLDPEQRYSAEQYLDFWGTKDRRMFPDYFYNFLHQYMGVITDPSSGRYAVKPLTTSFGEADERIDRIYQDYDKIAQFLHYNEGQQYLVPKRFTATPRNASSLLEVEISLPSSRHTASAGMSRPPDDGMLLFLAVVMASVRHTARAAAKLRACELFLAFAERSSDETKMDRIIPYIITLLDDKSVAVRIAALRTLTQVLALVHTVTPVNAYIFTEYIRPRLQDFVYNPLKPALTSARAAYATCISTLAHSSLRILDVVQALRADGSVPQLDSDMQGTPQALENPVSLYDSARADLIEHFEGHTIALLQDPDAGVRRAFLGSIASLCVFFGSKRAKDVVLTHLNTYFNDSDWMLRCALLRTLVGIATFVGSNSFESYVLPLMLQALSDPEEFVVTAVIEAFASSANLGILSRAKTWEMSDILGRFMVHPSTFIRSAAISFEVAAAKYLSPADQFTILRPLLQPFLRYEPTQLDDLSIAAALLKPLSRQILEAAITWCLATKKGLFWKASNSEISTSLRQGPQLSRPISLLNLSIEAFKKVPKNDEDEQWLLRLRNLGMAQGDEIKLLALKVYITRTAARRPRDVSALNGKDVIAVKDLGLHPQTIFFEKDERANRHDFTRELRKPTIADALLDASTTIADAPRGRKGLDVKFNQHSRHATRSNGTSRRTSSRLSSEITSPERLLNARRPNVAAIDELTSRMDQQRLDNDLTMDEQSAGNENKNIGRVKGIVRKGSALDLLKGHDKQKSLAAISTNETTAQGELGSLVGVEGVEEGKLQNIAGERAHFTHTYLGGDPHVKGVLNGLVKETYPVEDIDFGPKVVPIAQQLAGSIQDSSAVWRPSDLNLASFVEHTNAITRILPSPDHLFFLTASDDGSVKVWDVLRLERNLIHRSRLTHQHTAGTHVKTIAFMDDTHTFASCASNGEISIVHVDCSLIKGMTRYGGLRVLRTYHLKGDEHGVWCEYAKIDGRALLLVATSKSRILAFDLRSMTIAWSLVVPLKFGPPKTFCIDRKRIWMVVGTTQGVLVLFDLRFQLELRSWAIPDGQAIHGIIVHPLKGRGKWILVSGGVARSEITAWDVTTLQCKEVYRGGESGLHAGVDEAVDLKNRDLLKPYSPLLNPKHSLIEKPAGRVLGAENAGSGCMNVFIEPRGEQANNSAYLITPTSQGLLQFWDLASPTQSFHAQGLLPQDRQPQFSSAALSIAVPVPSVTSTSAPGTGTASTTGTINIYTEHDMQRSNREVDEERKRVGRRGMMEREVRGLLRRHGDDITDVAVVIVGRGAGGRRRMVVSGDRGGRVMVYI